MKAQIIQNEEEITNIVYPNRYKKWISMSTLKHLRFINLLKKTEDRCLGILSQVAEGKCSEDLALNDTKVKFKKLQDEVLSW